MVAANQSPELPEGVSRTKLLLVDDEPELRRMLRRALERAGYEVVEAADGQAALQLSRQLDFDVVVSDICMPLMTGLELLERLSLEAPKLPVLFVSGSTNFMDRETARGCGAFDFMQKPVDLGELRARAAVAAEEHRRRRGEERVGARDSETRLIPVVAPRRALGE